MKSESFPANAHERASFNFRWHTSRQQRVLAFAIVSAVGTLGTSLAFAADDDERLGKITVTSRNREELAQEVPLPVQVLGGAQLERDGVLSIWDIPEKAPNLQINPPGENARKVSPSIRGIGRNGANDSAEGSVGVIVDGVTLYYAGQAWADYVDLDRIEVLRGPQGTLMGKNTTLGAINIVTKLPSFTSGSSFEVATGSLHSLNGKFSSTGAIIDDKLAFRGTLVVDRANGVFENVYQSMGHAKETWNEKNRLAARLQFLWTPTENVSNRLIVDKLRSDERVNLSFPWDNGPATWADGLTRPTAVAPAPYNTGSYANYGYLGRFTQRAEWFHNADGSPYQPILGTQDFENAEARPQITNQWGISNQLTWYTHGHTLTSISAYRYQDFDIKNGGQTRFYIGNGGQQLWNKQLSQELRITSDPGNVVDYQAGLYFLKAQVYSDDPDYNGPDAGAWFASNGQYTTLIATPSGRELLRTSLDGLYQSLVTDARVRSFAAYGQADWHISEPVTLTAGVRQTREHKTNRASQQLDRPGLPLTATYYPAATLAELAAANGVRTGRIDAPYEFFAGQPIDDDLTAWNVGPSYQVTKDVLVYASAGQGIKSGFIYFNPNSEPTQANFERTIKQEKSLDFELGVKSLLFDRTLQLNVNLYRTKVTDYQTSFTTIQSDGVTVLSEWTNAPGVQAIGVEFESGYQFNQNLSLNASGAYNEATYESEWLIARSEIDTSLPQYSGANIRNRFDDFNGEQLANAPRTTLNLGLNYQHPIGNYVGRTTLSTSYRSGTYLNSNLAPSTYQESYTLTNVGVGIATQDHKYDLSLLVRNAFDKFYATAKGTYSSTAARSLQLGAPRYWEVSLRARL
ncbi:MAG TPA: TonB-dependent receptor [Steroidobacteraceae bacterium]|nr:TonB-dependent receptor [Steroidobacteraceae bacterium]